MLPESLQYASELTPVPQRWSDMPGRWESRFERERRRLLSMLELAPPSAVCGALRSRLLSHDDMVRSEAVAALGTLLPPSEFPAPWRQIIAGE